MPASPSGVGEPFRGVVVVPCYNEAARLDLGGFSAFAAEPRLSLLFVDDGSTDGTAAVLARLAADLGTRGVTARLLSLRPNQGKGEAVRRGMLEALRDGASVVGYYDADLATPVPEMVRLVHALVAPSAEDPGATGTSVDVALGVRVALLGRRITRKAYRHYLGRAFATFASLILAVPIYDTQCGAKVFRRTPALEAALARPFVARWAFDVELIGRLLAGAPGAPAVPLEGFVEIPLREWNDVAGSTLRPIEFPRLGLELARIHRSLRGWRAG